MNPASNFRAWPSFSKDTPEIAWSEFSFVSFNPVTTVSMLFPCPIVPFAITVSAISSPPLPSISHSPKLDLHEHAHITSIKSTTRKTSLPTIYTYRDTSRRIRPLFRTYVPLLTENDSQPLSPTLPYHPIPTYIHTPSHNPPRQIY